MASTLANVRLVVARVERQHAVIEELRCASPKRVTTSRLASRLGVSTRTVERDIADLRQAGVPISVRTGPHGGYTMPVPGGVPPIAFTPGEMAALVVSLAAVGPYVSASAQSAMTKLLTAVAEDPSSAR